MLGFTEIGFIQPIISMLRSIIIPWKDGDIEVCYVKTNNTPCLWCIFVIRQKNIYKELYNFNM